MIERLIFILLMVLIFGLAISLSAIPFAWIFFSQGAAVTCLLSAILCGAGMIILCFVDYGKKLGGEV